MILLTAGSVVFFAIRMGQGAWALLYGLPLSDPLGTVLIYFFGTALTPLFIYLTWWLLGNITAVIVSAEAGLNYSRLGRRMAASWPEIKGYKEALTRSPYGASRVTTVWMEEGAFSFYDHLENYGELISLIRKRVEFREEPLRSPLGVGRVGHYLWLGGQMALALLGVVVIVVGILGAVSAALEGSRLGIVTWLTLFLLGFGLIAWIPEEFNKPLRTLAGRLGELGLLGGGLLLFSLIWLYPTVGGLQQENKRQVVSGLLLLGACFLPGAGLSLLGWWRGHRH